MLMECNRSCVIVKKKKIKDKHKFPNCLHKRKSVVCYCEREKKTWWVCRGSWEILTTASARFKVLQHNHLRVLWGSVCLHGQVSTQATAASPTFLGKGKKETLKLKSLFKDSPEAAEELCGLIKDCQSATKVHSCTHVHSACQSETEWARAGVCGNVRAASSSSRPFYWSEERRRRTLSNSSYWAHFNGLWPNVTAWSVKAVTDMRRMPHV